MIEWIAAKLIAGGVATRFARPLAIAVLIGAAGLAFWGGKALYDRAIIGRHDAAQEAADAREQIDREHKADDVELDQRARDAAAAEAVKGAIDNAVDNHPEASAAPVGPATSAALDELRRSAAERR